jgi:hypothetical protein
VSTKESATTVLTKANVAESAVPRKTVYDTASRILTHETRIAVIEIPVALTLSGVGGRPAPESETELAQDNIVAIVNTKANRPFFVVIMIVVADKAGILAVAPTRRHASIHCCSKK